MEHKPNGVVCIDFDGTIFPFGPLWSDAPPNDGAVDVMHRLKSMGYTIAIFSSRLSKEWAEAHGEDVYQHQEYMAEMLDKHGVPWDRFVWEKVKADFYVDDRAVEFRGDWYEVFDKIKDRGDAERSQV